jgi:hypothetical protein
MVYKKYKIEKHPFIENFHIIKKGDFKIGTASTEDEAKKAVDAVVGETISEEIK